MKIAIVGGTGKEGHGMAVRWLRAGHTVRIGSRDTSRAQAKAVELRNLTGGDAHGSDNLTAVGDAQVVMLSIPYGAHSETVVQLKAALAGKVVVDITVPLSPPHVRRVTLPTGNSAALEAQAILGDSASVVAALHHVSSAHLASDHAIDCDVFVCSNDERAIDLMMPLVRDLSMRGIHAGVLQNSIALESLTPVLLHINKHYRNLGVGIRVTGL
jgi:NADPH-dependent F420 reductase